MPANAKIIPIFIPHAGCPHMCSFCNQRTIAGQIEPTAPGNVRKILDEALRYSGDGAELAYYGGSFTALPRTYMESLLDVAQPYINSGQLSYLRVSTRPDAICGEILDILRRKHVGIIELGAQSADDGVLSRNHRGHTFCDVQNASQLIRSSGFTLGLQMMTGLAGDDESKSLLTCERIIECEPKLVRIYPTVVLPGTELYDMWRTGQYSPPGIYESAELCAKLYERFVTAGIKVIRTGLNTSDELGTAAVAGAYHPAFGELVQARVFRNRALDALCGHSASGKAMIITVAQRNISKMIGQHRENIKNIEVITGAKWVMVRAGDMCDDSVNVSIQDMPQKN